MESIILPFNGYNYQRMRPYYYKIIILPVIFALILIPVLVSARGDIQRGEKALAEGRPMDASEQLEHAATLLFWRDDLRERAGRAAFEAGDNSTAARLLGQVKNLSVDGWTELGSAEYQLGRYAEAADALQRGLSMHGPNVRLYRMLVQVSNAVGDQQGELAALKNYLTLDDGDSAVHHRLGLLLSVIDSENALPELMISARLDKAYDPAVQTMRSALNLALTQPDESDRMVTIGRGLGLVQEWQLAHQAFEQAVDADRKNAEAWAWLGEAKQHLGMDGGVEIAQAVALKPFSASVRALYGLYWNRKGEAGKALTQFQWAAAIEPENPALITSLADAYVFAGDLPKAMAAYVRATELAPTEALYWKLLALFTAQFRYQVEETGIPAAQQVLNLRPDDPGSYDLLGWVYLAADKYELAKDTLLTAVRLNPDYSSALLHLGMACLQLEEIDEARTHLQRVRALDPDGADGQQAARLLDMYFP
jgi:tetratricopeptide (TPR) repeat protein